MHADKHQKLLAAGHDVAKLVLTAAILHRVGVDDIVREALVRGDRPAEARQALASLPQDIQRKLAKLSWPWDCPLCLDAVDIVSSCRAGHIQCEACLESTCPACSLAERALAARNAKALLEADAKKNEPRAE